MPADLARAAETEIRELHAFFQAWFRAETPPTDDAFARFEGALAPGFEIVTPDGVTHDREAILDIVRRSRGADAQARIWIERPRLLAHDERLVVASYEEWQEIGAEVRVRLSTAVFQRDGAGANGLRWLRVHETWLAR